MTIRVDIKRYIIYIWIGIAYFLLFILIDLINAPTSIIERIINNVWRLIYIVIINIIFFEYTVPFVLRKRRIILYNILLGLVALWLQMILCSFGLYAWRLFGIQLHIWTPLKVFPSMEEGVSHGTGYGIFSIVFFGVIKHIYDYQKLKASAQRWRIEKQEAELNYLKSQTNPHFLFNTLNNIYSLARDKSDLAPESILRLSKILRFMLYETTSEFIAIEQELKIISDYISLEKLRYDESLRVNFNYDVEDMRQGIPPLLLMPLVENAFKHGVSESRTRPFVDIHLSVQQRQLGFFVKNSSEVSHTPGNVKENIGLSNLRRQLELLYSDYQLSVQQNEAVFTATLKINLSSHVENKMHHNRR
jgi:two-component system LytT family sensor kinase